MGTLGYAGSPPAKLLPSRVGVEDVTESSHGTATSRNDRSNRDIIADDRFLGKQPTSYPCETTKDLD